MTTPSPAAPREREVKLAIPEAAWAQVLQALRAAPCRRTPLHATYHDTPRRELAAAGIALRVRREGTQWVQTLKAAGAGPLDRLEDNLPLPGAARSAPAADLARHRRPQVRALVRDALGLQPRQRLPALEPVFTVRVQRLSREVAEGASRIEIALDEGTIEAGGLSLAVREVEFELVEGDLQDLLQLARRWRERHGLWVSLDSKAARGHRLALGRRQAPPQAASRPRYPAQAARGEVAASILRAALAQAIANADAIATGSADPEHVHQLRVGLRRLRTALREVPLLRADGRKFEAALAGPFRALGAARDRGLALAQVQDMLARHGLPPVAPALPADLQAEPAALVRDPAFQDALLALLARAEALAAAPGGHVRRELRPRLDRLLERVLEEGRRFRRLEPQGQHQVRKRLKRLRYLAEGVRPLFPARRVSAFVDALEPVQDALGEYNDTLNAIGIVAGMPPDPTLAAILVPELDRRRARQAARCQKLLRSLAGARAFWRK